MQEVFHEKPAKDMQEMYISIEDSPEQREKQREAVYVRELAQIRTVIKKHQKEYLFDKDTEIIIEQILEDHPELKDQIEFKLVEE